MADTVVKTVEDVDRLFSQIVVNGETFNSDRYVPPAPVQVIEEPEPQQTVPSQSASPSVPSGQTVQGEDVYGVVLNDEQHDFVDPDVTELIPPGTSTENMLVNQSGIQDAVDTAVENAVADLDVPQAGGSGKYIKAISETNGKISATEGTIADTVESGNSNPVTSNAVSQAISGASGDIEQEIRNAINDLDVPAVGGDGEYISAIGESNGKISATAKTIATSVESGNNNPVSSDAVNSALAGVSGDVTQEIADAIGALDVASAGGSGKFIQSISETDGKINAIEGTIDNTVTQNSSNPVTGGAVKTAIDNAISSVYKPAGDKAVAQLTSALLVAGNLGDVYNITDSGTTTSDFVEGAGHPIKAGDNVAVVDVGTSSNHSYKFDLIGGFIDLSDYIRKSQTSGLVKNDGTIDTTAYAKQSEMSVTPGTGANADKTTIQLKTGTSATVLTQHTPAGTVSPNMDGTASPGSAGSYSRSDHVHPKDTSKADKVANATNGNFAGLDSNGNITDSGKKASDFLPADTPIPPAITVDSALSPTSTNPVQNKVINTALSGKADTEDLKVPTDAVLHYSFDEVPDLPDGNADVRLIDNNTYQIQSGNYKFVNNGGTTFTNNNGKLQCVTESGGYWEGFYINKLYTNNKVIKMKFKITALSGNVLLYMSDDLDYKTFSAVGEYEISCLAKNVNSNFSFVIRTGNSATVIIDEIYIGDGSYSTPIIDNANGQFNATNNGGIAVQGVSGKGLLGLGRKNIVTTSTFPKPTDKSSITLSIWVKYNGNYTDTGSRNLFGTGSYNNSFCIYQQATSGNKVDLVAFIRNASSSQRSIVGYISDNEWHNAVMIWKNKTLSFYIDGVLLGSQSLDVSDYTFGSNYWRIGDTGVVQGNEPPVIGTIEYYVDDAQIFDRALSETEVQALYYNHGNTPKYFPSPTNEIKQDSPELATSGAVFNALGNKADTNIIYDTSITDCNNAYQKGKTVTYLLGANVLNTPSADNEWYVLSQCNPSAWAEDNYITQIATLASNISASSYENMIYIRHCHVDGLYILWGDWHKIITSSVFNKTIYGVDIGLRISSYQWIKLCEFGATNSLGKQSAVLNLDIIHGNITGYDTYSMKIICGTSAGNASEVFVESLSLAYIARFDKIRVCFSPDNLASLYIHARDFGDEIYYFKVTGTAEKIVKTYTLNADPTSYTDYKEVSLAGRSFYVNNINLLQLPETLPSANGTYVLKMVKSAQGRTFEWVLES